MTNFDSLLYNVASFISALFLLEYGADKFIDNTAVVAKRLNVSPTLVGLLTCGTEWEELVVIALALGQKQPSLALGNLVGSSIANVLAGFSFGLLFMESAMFDRSSKIYTAVLLGITSVFVLILYAVPLSLRWLVGIVLMVAFVVYIASVLSLIYKGTLTVPADDSESDADSDSDDSDLGEDEEYKEGKTRLSLATSQASVSLSQPDLVSAAACFEMEEASPLRSGHAPRSTKPRNRRPKPLWKLLFGLMIGLTALVIASYIIAHSASTIGFGLGLSSTVIGTTMLSLTTTLPEQFVAIFGGARKQPGILIANTVGSNIFLVTLCGGVLFVWGEPDQIDIGFTVFEALVMWASAAAILVVVMAGGKRWMGAILIIAYVSFLGIEFAIGRRLGDDDF